jgi:beta-glucosidase
MNKTIVTGIVLLWGTLLISQTNTRLNEQEKEIDLKVGDLIKKMTLKEKVGQMSQIDVATFIIRVDPLGPLWGPMSEPHALSKDSLQKYVIDYGISSIFNIGSHGYTIQQWYIFMRDIQNAVNETRLKIPVLYGLDAIHGASLTIEATLFPQQLGMGSTWNPDLVEKAGEIAAYEMRASNIPLNFGPSLDLGKHPLWSRLDETYGEDVLLTTTLAKRAVDGMEGRDNDISDKTKMATNIKHYIAYSFPVTGKDRTQAWIPEHYVREYFLPQFIECLDAGAHTVILNSGEINGIPVHCSKYWLTDVLRNELGFKGIVIADWRDIEKLWYFHHVAPTYKEAILMAIDAGIDMDMVPYDNQFMDLLIELVKEGKIAETRIDESVKRILKLKYELGLFDMPFRDPKEYPDFGSEKFRQVCLQSAHESIILLKNTNSILPLAKTAKVLVTGPAANTMQALNGGWTYSWQGNMGDQYASEKNTILEAIRNKVTTGKVEYLRGSDFYNAEEIDKAIEAARNVDYIILCLGEPAYSETPGFIEDLYLPDSQKELAKAMAETGKPVILMLSEGRPRLISKFEPDMKGIVLGFLPGNEGGDAFADVLFGDYNPNGKLPVTYPKYPNDLMNYDHKFSDLPDHRWGYNAFNPQYPFGFGLSYTTFVYSDLKIQKDTVHFDDNIVIAVDVKNTGIIKGKEVVQLYIRDVYANITPPIRRLRGFKKITLEAGEQQTVTFNLKADNLKYVGPDNKWTTEEGDFEVYIEKLNGKFYLKK